MGLNMGNFVIWLLILIFVSFFVASFSFGLYCFVAPFAGWFEGVREIGDLLLTGVRFPQTCAERMLVS